MVFEFIDNPSSTDFNEEIGDGSQYSLVGWGNNEYQTYVNGGSYIENGVLVIAAKKITEPIPTNSVPDVYNPHPYLKVGNAAWSSGKLTTKNKLCFQYGSLEIVAKMPLGSGNWFAAWLLGHDYDSNPWPYCGEIDLFEYCSKNPDQIISSANSQNTATGNIVYNSNTYTTAVDVANTFNKYRIDWNTNGITWFFNDVQTHFILKSDTSKYPNAVSYPFDKPFYLILNNAIGGNLGAPVDPNMTSSFSYIQSITYTPLSGGTYIQTRQPMSPWSSARGIYSTNNGFSPFEGPTDPFTLRTYPAGNIVFSTPSIDASGNVYFGCDDGSLYSYDLQGVLRWKTTTSGYKLRASPTLSSMYVYVADMQLNPAYEVINKTGMGIRCYDFNGTLIATKIMNCTTFSALAILNDGKVIASCCDGYVYCFNEGLTGSYLWRTQINTLSTTPFSSDTAVYLTPSSPAVGADGTIYIGSYNGYVYAINPNGTLSWSYNLGLNGSTPIKVYTSPAVHENLVYFTANNGILYAFNTVSSTNTPQLRVKGTILWSFDTRNPFVNTFGGGDSFGSPTIGKDGSIYFTSWEGNYNGQRNNTVLYAISSGGAFKWYYKIEEAPYSNTQNSPLVDSQGNIYLASKYSSIIALKDNTTYCTKVFPDYGVDGEIYGSMSMDNNGILYVGTTSNKVYAIHTRPDPIQVGKVTQTSIELLPNNFNSEVYDNDIYQGPMPKGTPFTLTGLEPGSVHRIRLDLHIGSNNRQNIYVYDSLHVTVTLVPIPISPICFLGNTPISIGDETIMIKDIDPKIHKIHHKKIVAITQTISPDKYLVMFMKNSLGPNMPSANTVMSKDHKLLYHDKFVTARSLLTMDGVKKVVYNGETLYNILLEEHDKVTINNLVCETLDPNHLIAKVYRSMFDVSRLNQLIKKNKLVNSTCMLMHNVIQKN